MNYRYRINYQKNEGMRYTSNLDVHKMWERAFRRAKFPLVYSQGFHPQPKIQLASPLPLGFLSEYEIVDFIVDQEFDLETIRLTLTKSLPEGISVNSVLNLDLKEPALQTQVIASDYHVFLLEEVNKKFIEQRIEIVMNATSIPRTRRGKSYDLRPLIYEINSVISDPFHLQMVLSSKDGETGRPEEVLSELEIPLELTRIVRKKILFQDNITGN